MAGMFDRLLNETPEKGWSTGERIAAAFPLGIFGAFAHRKYRENRDAPQYDPMFQDPSQLDPLGQRVQQRMLERSGGNLTTPGFMAQNMLTQEARTAPRMANAYDSASQRLMAAGQVDAGSKLGMYGNKAYGAPIKPEEGQLKPLNFTKNGEVKSTYDLNEAKSWVADGWKYTGVADQGKAGKLVSGAELGMTGVDAQDSYLVEYNDNGTIKSLQSANQKPKTTVSVGGAQLYSPSDTSGAARDFGNSIKASSEAISVINGLEDILKRNPEGGVTGYSGLITQFAGTFNTVTDFVASLGGEEKSLVNGYTGDFKQFAKKVFPTADQALAEALTVELGYSLARINNMGTSGGGRGITDADMKFALRQLATYSSPADMLKVLGYQKRRIVERLEIDKDTMKAIQEGRLPMDLYNKVIGSAAGSQGTEKKKYSVGDIVESGGKRYKVVGGDPYDPDVEELP